MTVKTWKTLTLVSCILAALALPTASYTLMTTAGNASAVKSLKKRLDLYEKAQQVKLDETTRAEAVQ